MTICITKAYLTISQDYPHAKEALDGDDPVEDEDTIESTPNPMKVDSAAKSDVPPTPPPKPQAQGRPLPSPPTEAQPDENTPQKLFKVVGSYRAGVLRFVKEQLIALGFRETAQESSDVDVYWSRSFYSKLSTLLPHQKVNFLPAMAEICRKDFLNRMRSSSLPLCFLLIHLLRKY